MLYTATYRRASTVAVVTGLLHVFLAAMQRTGKPPLPKPWLFRGELAQPLLFRDCLLTLRDVVDARFYRPDLWRLLDPVVTCAPDWVRLECFSSCAGVYARADLSPDTFHEGELGSEGTTNVDFGPDFCAHLSGLRPGKRAAFEVGEDSVTLETAAGSAVEHQVELPERWVRGFLQVQALQRAATPFCELNKVQARLLLDGLPANQPGGQTLYLTPAGKLTAARSAAAAGTAVNSVHRLRLLRRLSPQVERLRVWAVGDGGPTFWVAESRAARVTMGLSSQAAQGFSGDGEALRSARRPLDELQVAYGRHLVAAGQRFTTAELAQAMDADLGVAGQLVDLLSEQGLLGYDLPEDRFYPRDLPYVAGTDFAVQPRDTHSRRLLSEGRIELEGREATAAGTRYVGWVQGDTATYRVSAQVAPDGRLLDGDCTCQWVLAHGLGRGPCKHILALRLAGEGDERGA